MRPDTGSMHTAPGRTLVLTWRSRRLARRYPGLLTLVGSALAALFLLPSSLTIPRSDPMQSMEFAPVPRQDGSNAPPGGDLSTLGLGFSRGPGFGSRGGGGPPAEELRALVRNPSNKRCVGRPPRQTEDPLAPPCVPYFDGENFGATHVGVTAEEVRLLYTFDGPTEGGTAYTGPTDRGFEEIPSDRFYDLGEPARNDDPPHVRTLRDLQKYFNTRYQTYNRFVRFFVYYRRPDPGQPAAKARADARAAYDRVRPFATIPYFSLGMEDQYLDEMGRRGVLSFGSFVARTADFYNRHPGHHWGYLPSVEVQARQFSIYVCRQVVPFPASFSGNPGENGRPRRLGLIYTTDPGYRGMERFGHIVKREVESCGGRFVSEATTPMAIAQRSDVSPDYGLRNMAKFRQDGVTTVIWAQGWEPHQSRAAANLGYFPEWVLAGDGSFEGFDGGQGQDQTVWERAWVVTPQTLHQRFDVSLCFQAFREGNPSVPRGDAAWACRNLSAYEDLRQLFTGVQVAGPRLTPQTMERGFRAIPEVASSDPRIPACYYVPGDYTCVKDGVEMWWDPKGRAPNARSAGCWRMPEEGRRWLPDSWPREDVPSRRRSSDPCNGYARGSVFAD